MASSSSSSASASATASASGSASASASAPSPASASASASAPSPAFWDASTVLGEGRSILELYNEDQKEEALARAASLADVQPSSAVAQNVAGILYYNAGHEALKGIGDRREIPALVKKFFVPAVVYYSAAARIAPTCVVTAISHADALAACEKNQEAYAEYLRAASTPDPADPAENNPGMDFKRSAAESKRVVMAAAKSALRNFQKWITRSYVPRVAPTVMLDLKSEIPKAVEAVKVANALANTYPFCARAQLLRAHALLEQATRIIPSHLNKAPLLERILATVTDAADTFDRSLLIALFRAKLLHELHRNEEAATECARAMSIRRPDDPAEDNVLRIRGDADRKTRVASVKKELSDVLEHLSPGSTANFAENTEDDEEHDDSSDEQMDNQSGVYAHGDLHMPARFEAYGPMQDPPVERIHFVAGEIVPQETVNIFALHCRARTKCSRRKTVCQMCSFEEAYDARIVSNKMGAHYKDKHIKKFPKKKQGVDANLAPMPTQEPVKCSEENCYVLTRTTKDMRLHYYFVHRLPAKWWIT